MNPLVVGYSDILPALFLPSTRDPPSSAGNFGLASINLPKATKLGDGVSSPTPLSVIRIALVP